MVIVKPVDDLEYYMDGYLKEMLESFKHAVTKKNTSIVMLVDGRSGMGKTTISNQIATYLDPKYREGTQIYFDPDKFFEEGLVNAKDGTCLVFDEAMIFSNRSAMSSLNRMLIQALSMIRSKRIFLIFNVNSIFDLDRNVVLSRADVLFHIYGDNLLDRGNFSTFFKPKGTSDRLKDLYLLGKKYYSYAKPKANFYGRFVNRFILNETEYETTKQKEVADFLKFNEKTLTTKQQKHLGLLIDHMHKVLKIPMDIVAEIGGMSLPTAYRVWRTHRKRME